MIPNQTLQYLISAKMKDAKVLIRNNRLSASINIAGYAIEIALNSGVELKMKTNFNQEWVIVSSWGPEIRYRRFRILKSYAQNYFKAAKKITKEIN